MQAIGKEKICKAVVAAFGVAGIAVVVSATGAAALEFKDIAGKWCTADGSEQFDQDNLIVILTSPHGRLAFPIVRYSYSGTQVTVFWKAPNGQTAKTVFGEFSADREHMVQEPSTNGGRRQFHRC